MLPGVTILVDTPHKRLFFSSQSPQAAQVLHSIIMPWSTSQEHPFQGLFHEVKISSLSLTWLTYPLGGTTDTVPRANNILGAHKNGSYVFVLRPDLMCNMTSILPSIFVLAGKTSQSKLNF